MDVTIEPNTCITFKKVSKKTFIRSREKPGRLANCETSINRNAKDEVEQEEVRFLKANLLAENQYKTGRGVLQEPNLPFGGVS